MQKGQIIFLSLMLAGGVMVGMTLGLAANFSMLEMITHPDPVEPVQKSNDSSHVLASDQISSSSAEIVSRSIRFENLDQYDQNAITKMLNNSAGQFPDSILHQDGTINYDALGQSINEAKLRRAKELVRGAI